MGRGAPDNPIADGKNQASRNEDPSGIHLGPRFDHQRIQIRELFRSNRRRKPTPGN